jgi:DNA-binding MarR family transcriptional regulator
MTLPPPQDATSVADRIHSAVIHLLRALRVEDDAAGVSAPRLSALSVLVFGGPRRPSELARVEQVTPATVSRLVALMESAGLVRREPDPSDGRAHLVHATPRGRALLEEGRRRRIAALARRLAHRTDQDRAALARAAELLEALAREVVEESRRAAPEP